MLSEASLTPLLLFLHPSPLPGPRVLVHEDAPQGTPPDSDDEVTFSQAMKLRL